MKLSVVTISFNNIDGLKKTEASIADQVGAELEWIVVDGGSKDGTSSYLADLQSNHPFAYVSEPDNGIYNAMNKGISMSTGSFVIFMNAGDEFFDADVCKSVSALFNQGCSMIYGDAVEEGGGSRFYKKARSPYLNWYSMFTHHQSIFYKRDLIADIMYDETFRYSGDWDLTSKVIAMHGRKICYHPMPVCVFERGGVSQSDSQRITINQEHWRVLTRTMGIHPVFASIVFFVKTRSNLIRSNWPVLYDRVRFKNLPANP